MAIGQAMWVYTSETIPSNGMAIVAFVNMVSSVIFGSLSNMFIKILGISGFFFVLGVIQIIGFCFVYAFIKEKTGNILNGLNKFN